LNSCGTASANDNPAPSAKLAIAGMPVTVRGEPADGDEAARERIAHELAVQRFWFP